MIKKTIDSIADDKKDHVLLGMFVGYPLQIFGMTIDIMTGNSIWFIIASVLGIAIVGAKEIVHDWLLGKGCPEWWDFIASAIPILATLITYLIII
tara:strand:+ start:6387 stop:6671 length:285 start_codon:yes stop_codon:yes gene_type:complete